MDNWLTKSARKPRIHSKQSTDSGNNKVQVRIEDLRKVVSLKKIVELKEKLLELETSLNVPNNISIPLSTSSSTSSSTTTTTTTTAVVPSSSPPQPSPPTATEALILQNLQTLSTMYVALEILEETGIGKIIYRYRKHPNPEISTLADNLYAKWRKDAKEDIIRREKKQALGVHPQSNSCRVTFVQTDKNGNERDAEDKTNAAKRIRDSNPFSLLENNNNNTNNGSTKIRKVTDNNTLLTSSLSIVDQQQQQYNQQFNQQRLVNQQLQSLMFDPHTDIEKDIEDWDRVCSLAAQSRYDQRTTAISLSTTDTAVTVLQNNSSSSPQEPPKFVLQQQQQQYDNDNGNNVSLNNIIRSSSGSNVSPTLPPGLSVSTAKTTFLPHPSTKQTPPIFIPPPPSVPLSKKLSKTTTPSSIHHSNILTTIFSPPSGTIPHTSETIEPSIPLIPILNRHIIQDRSSSSSLASTSSGSIATNQKNVLNQLSKSVADKGLTALLSSTRPSSSSSSSSSFFSRSHGHPSTLSLVTKVSSTPSPKLPLFSTK